MRKNHKLVLGREVIRELTLPLTIIGGNVPLTDTPNVTFRACPTEDRCGPSDAEHCGPGSGSC